MWKGSCIPGLNPSDYPLQQLNNLQQAKYIPQLDGLRGLAILMVMCYHYFPGVLLFNFGWSGVDLFFVLSGFLIAGRLIPYIQEKKILLKFYRNRFLRIVPLYFLFLLLFFSCWFLFTSVNTRLTYPFYKDHWWNFFVFIQNWTLILDFPPAGIHLNHLWSLAVEEQFYLVFPLLWVIIKNKNKILESSIAILFILVLLRISISLLYILPNEYEKIYWNTFFRADSFLAGVILYLITITKTQAIKYLQWIKWAGAICFLILITKILITLNAEKNNLFIASVGFCLIAIMYCGLMSAVLLKSNKWIAIIFSLPLLRFSGKISYGMYIIHWPLFLIGLSIIHKSLEFLKLNFSDPTILLLNALLCIPLTYLISSISFKYFESNFLKHKIKFQ